MTAIETPIWVKYAGDLFFLALFLIFFFFFKPTRQSDDEWDEDSENDSNEVPNPLEQILMSEDDENAAPPGPEKIKDLPSEEEPRSGS